MRKYILFSLITFLTVFSSVSPSMAQILDPIEWSFSVKETGQGQFDLVFTASLEPHWHLYTQKEVEDGPVPTSFSFEKNDKVKMLGKVKEGKSLRAYEAVFGDTIEYFENKAVFTQRIKVLEADVGKVIGTLEYMVCNDKTCLPPELVDFSFALPAVAIAEPVEVLKEEKVESVGSATEVSEILDPVKWTFTIDKLENGNHVIRMQAKIDEGWHVYARKLESDEGPIATEITVDESEGIKLVGEVRDVGEMHSAYDPNFMMNLDYFENTVTFEQEVAVTGSDVVLKGNVYFMVCDEEKCLPPEQVDFEMTISAPANMSDGEEETGSFWGIFIAGFFGGLIALLTPCVFPMIPLTVSFFTKQSKTRAKGISNAILYGLSIIVIYVGIGFGVAKIFGFDALNALSTNVYFNLAFFVLLVVFAISFFGAFEITLPSSWVNKADKAADRGGLIGIFFMAFTLSLVSFSCTGPIIGTLLVEAAVNGGIVGPIVGMFGFSLALALPFALFAAFPGWLNSLPSSGGWLNSVKVFLGFLELAFAFKFLSNADLVVQAGLLKREVFIAIWIAIFGMLTAYLMGMFQLPHDSKSDRVSVPRFMLAIASLMFTIYLIPGIWGAPLKLISGFPPPMFYSESPTGIGTASVVAPLAEGEEVVGDPAHCPHQLNCFHDYEEGMAYARKVGKPVMLDFTGWACVNCRKMEEKIWSDPSVLSILRDELVLISLYVDEKTPLPKEEQIEVKIGKKTKKLRTVGNRWSYFQAERYNKNAQPYYVIIDHDEQTLNGSASYADATVPKFRNWLREGVDKFHTGLAQK